MYILPPNLDKNSFKIKHSELIMQMQCIEEDLRIIYAAMRKGNFKRNYSILSKANLGKIINELYDLDNCDGHPELSDEDYDLIDEIRELRNYWCHRCYLDYVYIQDYWEQEREFQKIARQLYHDEERIHVLHKKLEKVRLKIVDTYR